MYEVDSDKFTSKPDPKKEFVEYFKESGAAAALQKAMTLLYRMPVKPTNLAEFFSQYFENGAQQLMRISLLKAELCYKRDELQKRRLKVQESENHIKEMIQKLGITDEQFNQRFVPEKIKEKNRLSILERYFKDIESGILRKTVTEDPNTIRTSSYLVDQSIQISSPKDDNYDFLNDCLKNVRSDHALKEDIKELDPWGIICKGPKGSDEPKKSFPKDHDFGATDGHHADEEHEPDDDDATSLAELFQQSSRDWVIQEHDESAANLHNRLLMIRKADKIKMSDFMGWTPLQSRENLAISGSLQQAGNVNISSTLRDSQNTENLKRRPCLQKRQDMLTQNTGSTGANVVSSQEPDNDTFLLEEDHLEHVNKMIETTRESFDYEFPRYSKEKREPKKEEICQPICELADLNRICSASVDAVYDLDNDLDMYGEDEYEDDSLNESLGFVPGKMMNWTNQYSDYPSCSTAGEYEFSGENGYTCDDSNIVDGQSSKPHVEVPMTRIDSSCHCIFTGAYDTSEMLSENEEDATTTDAVAEEVETNRKSTTRGGRLSLQKDEATITEDSALDNELQEVFKNRQNRRSSVKKEKEKKEEETDEPAYITDAFGIDLAKEVKRTILGMKASEMNNTSNDSQYAGHQSSVMDTSKSQGKPHYRPVSISQAERGMLFANKK